MVNPIYHRALSLAYDTWHRWLSPLALLGLVLVIAGGCAQKGTRASPQAQTRPVLPSLPPVPPPEEPTAPQQRKAVAVDPQATQVWTTEAAPVRGGPHAAAQPVESLPQGTPLKVHSAQEGWYFVTKPWGVRGPGWVEAHYVTVNAPAVELLLAALTDPNREVRLAAVWTLGQSAESRAVEPLTAALKDPDEEIRKMAVDLLGTRKDARTIAPLIAVLEDQKEAKAVREKVALALSEYKEIQDVREREKVAAALSKYKEMSLGASRTGSASAPTSLTLAPSRPCMRGDMLVTLSGEEMDLGLMRPTLFSPGAHGGRGGITILDTRTNQTDAVCVLTDSGWRCQDPQGRLIPSCS